MLHDASEDIDTVAVGFSDSTLASSVQSVVAHFRHEADMLLEVQMHLADRQAVNHVHIMALFQAYAQAQVSSQLTTEARLQLALGNTPAQVAVRVQQTRKGSARNLKNEIEVGLNRVIEERVVRAMRSAESEATKRVSVADDALRLQLHQQTQVALDSANTSVIDKLNEEAQLVVSNISDDSKALVE